jgi:hypothetical protein
MQNFQLISLTNQCIHNIFIYFYIRDLYNITTAFNSQQKFLRLHMYTLYHGRAPEHLHNNLPTTTVAYCITSFQTTLLTLICITQLFQVWQVYLNFGCARTANCNADSTLAPSRNKLSYKPHKN